MRRQRKKILSNHPVHCIRQTVRLGWFLLHFFNAGHVYCIKKN